MDGNNLEYFEKNLKNYKQAVGKQTKSFEFVSSSFFFQSFFETKNIHFYRIDGEKFVNTMKYVLRYLVVEATLVSKIFSPSSVTKLFTYNQLIFDLFTERRPFIVDDWVWRTEKDKGNKVFQMMN